MKKILALIMLSGAMCFNTTFVNAQNEEKKCDKSCCESKNGSYQEDDDEAFSDIAIIEWAMSLSREMASMKYTEMRKTGQTVSEDGTTIENYWCMYKCNDYVTDILIDFYEDVAYLDMNYCCKEHPTYKHEMEVLEAEMYEKIQENEDCGCYFDLLTE